VKDESAGIIRFQDSWGPRIIPSSTEDGSTALLEKQKGYSLNALLKSSLINGENLIAKAKVTLNKQIIKIIVQLQRLSERTFLMNEATVRTA